MKRIICFIIASAMLLLASCAKPEQQSDGYDESVIAQQALTDVSVSRSPSDETEPRHISTHIGTGDKIITIDADVIVQGNADEMGIYNVDYSFFSMDEIGAVLYGTDDRPGLFLGEAEDTFLGQGSIISGYQFGIWETLDADFAPTAKSEEHAMGCEISFDRAQEIADSFIELIGASEFALQSKAIVAPFTYHGESSKSGCYEFVYLQQLDGFPLETVSANVFSGVSSNCTVRIDDRGIFAVRMSGLDILEKTECAVDIMPVGEAVSIIENDLDELWLSPYAPIVEIRLEYLLDETIYGTLELVPCWHFCVDQTKIHELPLEIARENDSNDICVNAVTGECFRVGDQYPAFVTADTNN